MDFLQSAVRKYNILGTDAIIDKMKVMGLPRHRNFSGRFEVLMQKSTDVFNNCLSSAQKTKRNLILDQTNVYQSARRRKMKPFKSAG